MFLLLCVWLSVCVCVAISCCGVDAHARGCSGVVICCCCCCFWSSSSSSSSSLSLSLFSILFGSGTSGLIVYLSSFLSLSLRSLLRSSLPPFYVSFLCSLPPNAGTIDRGPAARIQRLSGQRQVRRRHGRHRFVLRVKAEGSGLFRCVFVW